MDSISFLGTETVTSLKQEYHDAIERSKCLYVGNLSYFTTEAQLYEFFSRCGEVIVQPYGYSSFSLFLVNQPLN
jgi:RNA recognition motif-containing protein